MIAETTVGKNVSLDQFESHGLESDQENVAPENSVTGIHPGLHDKTAEQIL